MGRRVKEVRERRMADIVDVWYGISGDGAGGESRDGWGDVLVWGIFRGVVAKSTLS